MRDDVKIWIDEAEENLVTAKLLYEGERFKDVAFYCQQIAEKSLKALQVNKLNRFDKIHDLIRLAQTVGAGKEIIEDCSALVGYYADSRYPVTKMVNEEEAKDLLDKCEGVLEWVKSNLK
jgi:HEPN domain-containing protein